MIRHHNAKYSGGFPIATGDRYFAQDLLRDLRYLQQQVGKSIQMLSGNQNSIYSGLVVTQGTGEKINITVGSALIKYNVTIPHPTDTWAKPPNTTTDDIYMITEILTAVSELDISGTYTSGGATNYVKMAYTETDGNTRTREKKAGSYSYETLPSYVITVDTTAPTGYEVELTRFTESGGTFTFNNSYRNFIFNINNDLNINGNITSQVVVSNTTQSTTSSTGALVSYGGLGVVKDVNIGGDVDVSGDVECANFVSTEDISCYNQIIAAKGFGFSKTLSMASPAGSDIWNSLVTLLPSTDMQCMLCGGAYDGSSDIVFTIATKTSSTVITLTGYNITTRGLHINTISDNATTEYSYISYSALPLYVIG